MCEVSTRLVRVRASCGHVRRSNTETTLFEKHAATLSPSFAQHTCVPSEALTCSHRLLPVFLHSSRRGCSAK